MKNDDYFAVDDTFCIEEIHIWQLLMCYHF